MPARLLLSRWAHSRKFRSRARARASSNRIADHGLVRPETLLIPLRADGVKRYSGSRSPRKNPSRVGRLPPRRDSIYGCPFAVYFYITLPLLQGQLNSWFGINCQLIEILDIFPPLLNYYQGKLIFIQYTVNQDFLNNVFCMQCEKPRFLNHSLRITNILM